MMDPRWIGLFRLVFGSLLLLAIVLAGLKAGGLRAALAIAAAWLVPGAGHVVWGRWRKGLFFFTLLGLAYAFGMWITGFRAVTYDDNPFYYFGKYGSGITLLLAEAGSAVKAVPRLDLHPSWFDPGLLYVCVTGLLNLVVMLNVLDVRDVKSAPQSSPVPELGVSSSKATDGIPAPAAPEGSL